MTKVTILEQEPKEQKPLKPIEFILVLNINNIFSESCSLPNSFNNIELICEKYNQYDLMFAYFDDRASGCLFLGHFNDGIV